MIAPHMRSLRLLFLACALLSTSGYKFRCWWLCQDQTGLQNDYVEQRDRCRAFAQMKLDMAMRDSGKANNEANRRTTLVSLFGECMGRNGWTVSDAKPAGAGSNSGGALDAALKEKSEAEAAAEAARARSALSRSAECAFAREAASVSSLAAKRAQACDIECAQRLKAMPDAPRPAACSSGPAPGLETGAERVN